MRLKISVKIIFNQIRLIFAENENIIADFANTSPTSALKIFFNLVNFTLRKISANSVIQPIIFFMTKIFFISYFEKNFLKNFWKKNKKFWRKKSQILKTDSKFDLKNKNGVIMRFINFYESNFCNDLIQEKNFCND